MEATKMFIGLILLLGVGAYFLFFNKGNSKIKFPNSKSAEETLKERFVNGEIDEETYKKMKETLNG
jgi:putative membrane protein